MEKPRTKFIIAMIVVSCIALAAFVIERKGIDSQEAAAYLQAFLSAGAIFAAIFLAREERNSERNRARKRQTIAMIQIISSSHALVQSMNQGDSTNVANLLKPQIDAELTSLLTIKIDELPEETFNVIMTMRTALFDLLAFHDLVAEGDTSAKKLLAHAGETSDTAVGLMHEMLSNKLRHQAAET